MLYRFLRWLSRLTLNSYFRKFDVYGKELVPLNGPVIFVANHPSAFMDPMLVATIIKRPIYFLAAAEFFGKGFKAWIYTNLMHMIPVYRPTTLPDQAHKNDEVFSKCIELLNKEGALLVFPEGNSITEQRIRKLKTGVARMAIGSKMANGKDVLIVPVGLNYANPHRFQSDLFVKIGKAVSTLGYGEDKNEIVRLTDFIEKSLMDTVYHIANQELDSVVKKIDLVLRRKFVDAADIEIPKEQEFATHQNIIQSVQNISNHNPDWIKCIEGQIDSYLKKIRVLGISDGSISELSMMVSVMDLLRLTISFPFFLIGYLLNVLPYYATVYYFRSLRLFKVEGQTPPKKTGNEAFHGSVAMGIGMGMFLIFYISVFGVCVWLTNKIWMGLLLMCICYLSGLFTMQYIRWLAMFGQKLKLKKLVNQQREMFAALVLERKVIIQEIMNVISLNK